MKRKKYYQQELADAEAALMYLRVDLNKFKGDKDSFDFKMLLAKQNQLEVRIETLTELLDK